MWKCKRCSVEIAKDAVQPAIDPSGIFFNCPSCLGRNSLESADKSSARLYQKEFSGDSPRSRPFLRLEGDLFFRETIQNRTFQIQVTRECLDRVFGSDGSLSSDSEVTYVNLVHVLGIAANKVKDGLTSPIKVLSSDFGFM